MRRKIFFWLTFCVLGLPAVNVHASGEPSPAPELKGHLISLKDALAMGMQRNLSLQAVKMNIPIFSEDVVINESEFDPVIDARLSSTGEKIPTASKFYTRELERVTLAGGDAGISKKFEFGLQSRLSFETSRYYTNSELYRLSPQYKDYLILDLTQPLLRDFGVDPNTANLRVSEKNIRKVAFGYMEQAQSIGRDIEVAYYDLGAALEVLQYRKKSRRLALELLEGNQKKFEAGLVPITEVQEAKTAVASRDEQIVSAIQQVEIFSNKIKDLLEIRPGDPFYEEIFLTDPVLGIDQTHPNRDDAFQTALTRRPDLLKEKMELAIREIRIEYYDNQKLPRIDLGATLGLNGLSGRNGETNPYEGDYFDAMAGMGRGDGREWAVGLRFSYPLGNRAAEARFRRATQEKRQSVYRLKRLEGAAETQVKNALVNVTRSMERVLISERFEGLAQKTLEQEMELLKKGLSDSFHVLSFQNELIEANIRKVRALLDFNRGLADLYLAMGTNLERYRIVAEINGKEIRYEQ
jgi:outer membrane protein TolC